mgnify:CR=1 FL=1
MHGWIHPKQRSVHLQPSTDQPELVNIGHEHYVYGSKKEIEEYKAIREKGIPLKSNYTTTNISSNTNRIMIAAITSRPAIAPFLHTV